MRSLISSKKLPHAPNRRRNKNFFLTSLTSKLQSALRTISGRRKIEKRRTDRLGTTLAPFVRV
jgi:hypothetical protein